MKKNSYIIVALAGMLSMNSCNDDEFLPGNPSMEIKAENADALLVTVFRLRLKPRMWMCLFLR